MIYISMLEFMPTSPTQTAQQHQSAQHSSTGPSNMNDCVDRLETLGNNYKNLFYLLLTYLDNHEFLFCLLCLNTIVLHYVGIPYCINNKAREDSGWRINNGSCLSGNLGLVFRYPSINTLIISRRTSKYEHRHMIQRFHPAQAVSATEMYPEW